MRPQRWLLVVGVFFSVSVFSHANDSVAVRDIVKILDEAPAWSEMTKENIQLKSPKLIDAYIRISAHPRDQVRMAIEMYMGKYPVASFNIGAWSKVYAFNRFYFKVNELKEGEPDALNFGGIWLRNRDEVDIRDWPWFFGKEGEIKLPGVLYAYTGDSYKGYDEFKYFDSVYMRRPEIIK